MADVARTMVRLRFTTPPKVTWIYKQAINLVRNSFMRGYLRTYRRPAGPAKLHMLGRWMIPVAAARLRDGIAEERSALLKFLDNAVSGDDA